VQDKAYAYAQAIEEYIQEGSGPKRLAVTTTFADDLVSQTRYDELGTPTTRYVQADGFGSTRLLTDEQGTVTDAIDYDAFGNVIARVGTTEIEHLYRGEALDPNTGFYYLRAQYYDPSNGRFLNQDTFAGYNTDPRSLHKYTYTHNDPVNGMDPSGHMDLTELEVANSIQSTLTSTLRLASSALRIYDRVQAAVDFVEMGYEIGRVFATGGAVDALVTSISGFPSKLRIKKGDVVEKFFWNGVRAVGKGAMNWARGYIRSSQNYALRSILVYLPNPLLGTDVYTYMNTGLHLNFHVRGKRKKIPIKLVFGAPKGTYGQLMGVGMEMGGSRQLYRMDVHDWHGGRGGGDRREFREGG